MNRMKKHILFGGMMLMAAAFTACTEDFTDWASPIHNPQPDAITIPGLTASTAAANIDLNTDEATVQLVSLSSATMPEGTTLDKMRIYLTPVGVDNAEEKMLTAISAAEGIFEKEAVQELVVSNFGPRPTARTYDAHVYLDGIYNGQAAFIDAGALKLNLIPEAPQISENYYIVGGALDWAGSAASKEQKFSHSGADVYEDPVFTIVIKAAEGDTWFAIGYDEACDAIANDNDWSKLFGTTLGNGESGLEGTLDRRSNLKDDGSFKVPAGAKKIKVDINMMDRTYKITPVSIAESYYLIGGPGEWNAESARTMKFTHSSKDVFEDPVFTYIFEGTGSDMWFAFGDDEAIDAVAAGTWNKLFGTTGASEDLTGSFDRRYNLDGDHSFHIDGQAKYYRFKVNMAEMTYEITPVNIAQEYYLIGGPGEWNAESARTMKFAHSDKDVFDDPVFTYTFEGTGSDMWFAFGDAEAIDAVAEGTWNKLFGTTGASEDLKGSFDRRYNLDGDHSFHVDGQAKYYRFTVNMTEMTYEIAAINYAQFIYFVGATDGWNNDEQQRQRLESPACDGVYTGFIYMADPNGWGNEFKFQKTLGDWGTEVNSGQMTGGITDDLADGCGNFKATAGEGVYYVRLDLANSTLSGIRIQNMNLVGDFNGWNPADDAQQMTWNATDYCFEISGAGVTAAGWKFTANNAWGINLGGNALDDLSQDGPNISVAGKTIKLYPTRKTSDKIFCTVQ